MKDVHLKKKYIHKYLISLYLALFMIANGVILIFSLSWQRFAHSFTNMHMAYPLPFTYWLTGIMQLKGRYKTKAVHDESPFSKLASLNEALEVGQRDPKTRF